MRRRAVESIFALAILVLGASCPHLGVSNSETSFDDPSGMDRIAEDYVKLVLALGRHDSDYVDAYYGPERWMEEAGKVLRPLDEIDLAASRLVERLESLRVPSKKEPMLRLRRQYLVKQIGSLRARLSQLAGRRMTFDEESRALYDAVAPPVDEAELKEVLADLARILPGDGPVSERYRRFQEAYVIPPDKLDVVFNRAIDECRRRTLARISLPADESFKIEYVRDKAWSAYNWYQGGSKSIIQVNEDLPVPIDRAIDLACHEGYPGHHVYNALLEKHLVKETGWVEFSVYPLFSPQSLIAEGTANYGIEVAFPRREREEFERLVLFPLAGIDRELAPRYFVVQSVVKKLDFAGNEAARRYLDGEIDASAAVDWLIDYSLMAPAMAQRRVRFIDKYRSYVINYNLGQEMVRDFINRRIGKNGTDFDRWEAFKGLLSSPRLPSGLLE